MILQRRNQKNHINLAWKCERIDFTYSPFVLCNILICRLLFGQTILRIFLPIHVTYYYSARHHNECVGLSEWPDIFHVRGIFAIRSHLIILYLTQKLNWPSRKMRMQNRSASVSKIKKCNVVVASTSYHIFLTLTSLEIKKAKDATCWWTP